MGSHAGGVIAKELSTQGFSVVVLEQGPWRQAQDFKHDEYANWILGDMLINKVSDEIFGDNTEKF